MTIAEAKRFYEQDTKDYELKNNKELMNWIKNSVTDGYHMYIGIDELQELVDYIVTWYEIKYPEREFEHNAGTRYLNFLDIKRISNVMTIRQLLYRLPNRQLFLMECGYRARSYSQHPIYKNGKEADWKVKISMHINKIAKEESNSYFDNISYFLLHADHMTGEVSKDYELKEYFDSEEAINLEELLSIFKEKYTDKLDFTELEKTVYNHDCDMELRHRILQLAALKLLYSENTIPERGYERAQRFINEFNKELGLTLSTEEIDEIINRDYTKVSEKKTRK